MITRVNGNNNQASLKKFKLRKNLKFFYHMYKFFFYNMLIMLIKTWTHGNSSVWEKNKFLMKQIKYVHHINRILQNAYCEKLLLCISSDIIIIFLSGQEMTTTKTQTWNCNNLIFLQQKLNTKTWGICIQKKIMCIHATVCKVVSTLLLETFFCNCLFKK